MEEINEELLNKGFNAGYLLQKFEPVLAKALMAGLEGVELPYFEGVMAGAKQFVLEKELEKSDIFPGMDADFDLGLSDKDLDKKPELGKDDLDLEI